MTSLPLQQLKEQFTINFVWTKGGQKIAFLQTRDIVQTVRKFDPVSCLLSEKGVDEH